MSNYTVTTNFGAKDALASGNPAKLVVGAAYTTEFNNIATAIATKYDATTSITSMVIGAAPASTVALAVIGAASGAYAQTIVNGGGGGLSVAGGTGLPALVEYAGNAAAVGTGSLSVGQTGAGVSTILARGAQALNIGVNGGGQVSISSAGALTFSTASTFSSTVTTNGALTVTAGGASVTGPVSVTDSTGTVWGSPTGGAKGAGTINVAGGLYVNGTAVSVGSSSTTTVTKAADTTRTSNNTVSADPDLQVALLATSTYAVTCVVAPYTNTGSNGFQLAFNYSGTAFSTAGNTIAGGVGNSFGGTTTLFLNNGITGGISQGASQIGSFYTYTFYVKTNSSGTLSMQWAQVTSAAPGCTVQAGSYMTVTKIA